jgi:methyl-accepting chemotaxis protein
VGLSNLSIKAKLTILSGSFVLGMVAFGALSYNTITQVKIGSAAFDKLSLALDVQADFTPPTQFVVQERVLVYQARADVADKAKLNKEIDRFKDLTKGFEDGHEAWRTKVTDPKQAALVQKIYESGHAFLEVASNEYFPFLLQGNVEAADKVRIEEMNPQYETHAAATDEFGQVAQAQATEVERDTQSMVASRTFTLSVVALLALAVVLALCVIIAKGILTQLNATMEILHEVSEGNLTRHLEVTGTDEIAQMGIALNETIDNLSRVMSEIEADAKVLSSASEELSATSQQLGTNSQQTTTQAAAVSAAAEQVSQNVQTVSTATEEMSASIKEISKNASEAAEVASSAARLAGTTTTTMTKLSESSAEIGNVIKVITSIAEQTNLLALNATIEAARAGEAGKGFAVVANEVKELAKETAKATEDIGNKVEAIQNDAKGAVQAIDEITAVIGRINDIQNTIASAVEEQTGTTNEISRNISETAKGSSDIASNITGVATAATETQHSANASQKAADELSKLAVKLGGVVSQFKLADNGRHLNGRTRSAT